MLGKTSFREIHQRNARRIILFGSGNIASKTIRKIGLDRIDCIVDNSENLQGEKFEGLEIHHPNKVKSGDLVLICSTAIVDIAEQLVSLDLIPGEDFLISPILNDLTAISDLEQLEVVLYFTSGTVPLPDHPYGGGLYKCTVKGSESSLERLYRGPCYGAIRLEDSIYFVDTDKGILRSDENGIQHMGALPKKSRAHGISFNLSNEMFYVSCSYLDAVLEIDQDFKIKRSFSISDRRGTGGEPMHHCNDNLAIENSLYVSMFSSTGSWKRDVFDGCIAEFDLSTGKRLRDICQGLYMPHNVKLFDGSIHVLDSLPGHLRFGNFSIQGTFPGFTRGLEYHSGLYFIGQSKNRNFSKVFGLSNNVAIDCGVTIFNPDLKVSRFIQFPNSIGEVHSIVI